MIDVTNVRYPNGATRNLQLPRAFLSLRSKPHSGQRAWRCKASGAASNSTQETPVLQRVNSRSTYCPRLTSLLHDVASTFQDLLNLQPAKLKHAEDGIKADFRSPNLQCVLQGWQSEKVRWAVKALFAVDAEHFFVCANHFLLFNREQYDTPNFEIEINEMGHSEFLLNINFPSRIDLLPRNEAGFEKLRSLVISSLSLYKALLELPQAQVQQDPQQQHQLKARDDFLIKLQEKDADNSVAEQVLGKETFAKMQQTVSCDSDAVGDQET